MLNEEIVDNSVKETELHVKVSRPAGVLWNSSADLVVIMILLVGIQEEKCGHDKKTSL